MSIILTGGIACGKSTVAKILEEKGFYIIDADKIAHLLLDKSKDEIKKVFGAEFVLNDKVNRRELGKHVFEDVEKKRKLESILHPKIRKEIEKESKELEKSGKKYMVDIPLYFESRGYKAQKVIVVYAPKSLQLERLTRRDLFDKEEALKRIESQIDIEKKRKLADIVIDNSKDLAHLKREVENAIKQI